MNHIVMGTDDLNPVEMWLGLVGIGLVVLVDRGALFLVLSAAWASTRFEVSDLPDATAYVESPRSPSLGHEMSRFNESQRFHIC